MYLIKMILALQMLLNHTHYQIKIEHLIFNDFLINEIIIFEAL